MCTITFVYARNTSSERDKLCSCLIPYASSIHMPWVAFGDFNNALNPKNKREDCLYPFLILMDLEIVYYNVLYRGVNTFRERVEWKAT